MYIRHNLGQTGEDIAEIYLVKKGYKIIERNFSCRQGEIDIIAKYKEEVVFIEVKTRTNKRYGANRCNYLLQEKTYTKIY